MSLPLQHSVDSLQQEIRDRKQSWLVDHLAEFLGGLTPMIKPEDDASVVGEWLINVHPYGNEVGFPVPVHICRFQADEMSRGVADVMLGKIHFAVVLEPDDALRVRSLPEVVATDRRNIQIAVTVEVGRHRGAGPREIADGVMVKFEVAPIFEPLDAVPRPRARGQVIEGIPVGVQDVHQAVPIEVYQPDTAAAVVFVGAAPNQLRLEVSMSIVLKNVDL